MSKHLYFVRHGQSLANMGAKSLPNAIIPLTTLGHQQAIDLLTFWQSHLPCPAAIIHSTAQRAKQTALPFAAAYQLIPSELSCLDEFCCLSYKNIANMMGDSRAKLAQNYWQTADIHHKDGDDADSFSQFLDRVNHFMTIANSLAHNTVLFGHGIWLGLLAWRLLGCTVTNNADMRHFRQFQTALPMHNTVVYRLTIDNNAMQLSFIYSP